MQTVGAYFLERLKTKIQLTGRREAAGRRTEARREADRAGHSGEPLPRSAVAAALLQSHRARRAVPLAVRLLLRLRQARAGRLLDAQAGLRLRHRQFHRIRLTQSQSFVCLCSSFIQLRYTKMYKHNTIIHVQVCSCFSHPAT